MANRPTSRKRVFAFGLRRAPDGSAFQRCDSCGVLVPVALYDMHECGDDQPKNRTHQKKVLRSTTQVGNQSLQKPSFSDQPRSPFCIFMEHFKNINKDENPLEIDQLGFDTWKYMSIKEKYRFNLEADKVNMAHEKALLQEVADMPKVDDEADSAMVGKFDVNCEYWYDSETSGSPQHFDGYYPWY